MQLLALQSLLRNSILLSSEASECLLWGPFVIGIQSAAALGNFLLPTASAEDTLAGSFEAITMFSELTGQFENQTQGHLCRGLIERARCFL